MTTGDCGNEKVTRDAAADLLVCDVMLTAPKTLPADSSVADLRRLFSNSHVRTALVVDGPAFVGAVSREDLRPDAPDENPVRSLAREVDTIEPDAPVAVATAHMDQHNIHRLVVLDADGKTLRGLLCLTGDRGGFCQGSPPG